MTSRSEKKNVGSIAHGKSHKTSPLQRGQGGAKKKPPTRRFIFEDCLAFLETKGKSIYGNHFKVDPVDYEIIFKLLVYFIRDRANARKYGINLRKGILLSGPIGCGKTSLMNLMRFYLPPEYRHIMKSTREVSFEFIQDGYSIIEKYAQRSFKKNGLPNSYCFDDLGVESNLKYYGNDCNIMGEILLSRYDLSISRKLVTHCTTNLNSTEIESMYGNRIRSRMREMFNLVGFSQSSMDKRR